MTTNRPERGEIMRASIGDHVRTHGIVSTEGQHVGEIVEIRGANDGPPYVVRFPDGEEKLLYPGPTTVVEPRKPAD